MADSATRRDFIGGLATLVLGAAGAAASVYTAAWAVFTASGKTVEVAPGEISLGKLADFPQGSAREVRVRAMERDAWLTQPAEVGSVFVVREGADAKVLSASCPHLGCPVDYDGEKRQFACPCHRSVFSLDGARLSGPSPRGLDPLASSVSDGELRCRFVRFAPGVPQRRVI
jgi:Rieske Fe-S protein